jgi:hypothetical protein
VQNHILKVDHPRSAKVLLVLQVQPPYLATLVDAEPTAPTAAGQVGVLLEARQPAALDDLQQLVLPVLAVGVD